MAQALGGGEASGDQADRGALDIAFAAGDLAGEAQPRVGLEPKAGVEEFGRVEIGVAMDAAEPRELGALEPGDHAEDAALLAVLHLGLEADDVEQRPQRIVLPQLHDRIGLDRRLMDVGQSERLHRPVAQGLAAALGHDLDRQAAVEIGRALEFAEFCLLRRQHGVNESLVLVAAHRAVDVGRSAFATRPFLVVARLHPGDVHVDRGAVDDRGDGVEECERALAGPFADGGGERRGRQRSRGDDDIVPVRGRQAGDLAALERDERMGEHPLFDRHGETVAVYGERAPGRHLVSVG